MLDATAQRSMFRLDLAALAVPFVALILVVTPPSSFTMLSDQVEEPGNELTLHDCILIDGNNGFTAANGVVGGSGAVDDPYIIEKWNIPADGGSPPCDPDDGVVYLVSKDIWIRDTDRHFVIRDVLVRGVSRGIGHQGVLLDNVTNGRIENATVALRVFEADITVGIQVQLSRDVTLVQNTLAQNIVLEASSDITVAESQFEGASLGIGNTEGAIIRENRFEDGGVILRGQSVEHFTSHAIGTDNLVNGKQINYLRDCHDETLIGLDVGQLIIANCSDVTVAGLTIEDTVIGIDLAYVRGAHISGNVFHDVTTGISVDHTENVTIAQNAVANALFGFFVNEASNLTFLHNDISDSDGAGMFIYQTSGVTVQGNNLSGNYPGLWLWGVDDVLVVRNNFLKNVYQAFTTTTSGDRWDDGYPGGGNHWSDYKGLDTCSGPLREVCPNADGLGDTPYVVQVGMATDRYPLMAPYGPLNEAPVARLEVSLSSGEAPYVVTLDASASSDTEDPTSLLQVRWDWEDDGVWDTPWTAEKVAQRPYVELVPGPIRLQVRDTRGLMNSTLRPVPVLSLPEIVHIPVGTAVFLEPVTIVATVETEVGLADMLLHYQFEGGDGFVTVPMAAGEADTYWAQIPASTQGLAIRYFITAVDLAGNEFRDPITGEHHISTHVEGSPLGASSLLVIAVVGIAVTVVVYALFAASRQITSRRP